MATRMTSLRSADASPFGAAETLQAFPRLSISWISWRSPIFLNLCISWSSLNFMSRVDEHYLRVRDYAERFSLSESAVYKKIDRGEIRAIRIGKTVRIPSSEMERYLTPTRLLTDDSIPRDGEPHGLADRVARFEEETGSTPGTYVKQWRSHGIEDTPANARLAIEALALRAALEQPTLTDA